MGELGKEVNWQACIQAKQDFCTDRVYAHPLFPTCKACMR